MFLFFWHTKGRAIHYSPHFKGFSAIVRGVAPLSLSPYGLHKPLPLRAAVSVPYAPGSIVANKKLNFFKSFITVIIR